MEEYMKNSGRIVGAGIGSACVGFFGYLLCRRKPPQKDEVDYAALSKDLDAYRIMLKEVSQERKAIIATVNKIITNPAKPLLSNDTDQFFSEKTKLLPAYERKKIECEELISLFYELINSYPDFDNAHAKEPGYIKNVHKEMVEHHEKVKIITGECFKGLPNVDYQWQTSEANFS